MKNPNIVVPIIIILSIILCVITMLLFLRAAADMRGLNDDGDDTQKDDENDSDEYESASGYTRWQSQDGIWVADTNPTKCSLPFELSMPVDINKVTALLYPGQYRGDDYKAHGGFRFGSSNSTEISVIAPIDAYVYRGSRYLESGEIQYWFDFITECGLMYRFDHLSKLSPKLQELADSLPEPTEGDSRSQNFPLNTYVQSGEILSTAVGLEMSGNIFVDFGMYNLNTKNEASKQSGWDTKPNLDSETDPYGLCWIEFLPEQQRNLLVSLPSTAEGRFSDYCNL